MENVILTIHLILAMLLIGVVLLQRSEGGGLGIGGGGGAMSARGAATAMTKLTWIFATAFIITSMTLTVLSTRGGSNDSVLDSVADGAEAPEGATDEGPANPDLGGDLTAPGAADAPATPPRADETADETAPETNP